MFCESRGFKVSSGLEFNNRYGTIWVEVGCEKSADHCTACSPCWDTHSFHVPWTGSPSSPIYTWQLQLSTWHGHVDWNSTTCKYCIAINRSRKSFWSDEIFLRIVHSQILIQNWLSFLRRWMVEVSTRCRMSSNHFVTIDETLLRFGRVFGSRKDWDIC